MATNLYNLFGVDEPAKLQPAEAEAATAEFQSPWPTGTEVRRDIRSRQPSEFRQFLNSSDFRDAVTTFTLTFVALMVFLF